MTPGYICNMLEGLRRQIRLLSANTRFRGRLARVRRRYDGVVEGVASTLSIVVFVLSIACLTSMLVYVGYESGSIDRKVLMHVIHISQGVFIGTILFNVLFRLRKLLHDSLFVRRIADILVLLTLIPVIFPHGSGPTDEALHFLHSRGFQFTGLALYCIAELSYGAMQLLGRRTNPSLILSASFLFFILIGSLVLMLPRCTVGSIRYIDALFMASSAVSMTGLSTIDASATFTPLGWLVIGILMQIGALGVLTFTSFFALFFSGSGSIYNQLLMRDFIYSKSMGSLMPVILYILGFTLCIECAGAVAIYFTIPDDLCSDFEHKLAFAAFHSLSAFCNGGFTTLPDGFADPRLYNGNQVFYIVVSVLIIAGGIGFPNLVNFKDAFVEYIHRFKAWVAGRRYSHPVHVYDLNTRLVLILTVILFVGGAVGFYLFEYNNSMSGLPTGKRIVQSIFCSATVRTAGFATSAPGDWLGVTFLMAMMLMWIGCSSQSMGGGIKINTFAVMMLNLRSIVWGQKGVSVFGRSIALSSVRRANAVICFSILAIVMYSGAIMLMQPELPAGAVAFECFSAITTVGMSLGITDQLSDLSKIAIATAMFLGRVGIISVLCGLIGNRPDRSAMLPSDDIIIN